MPVTIGASIQPTNRCAFYYYDTVGSPIAIDSRFMNPTSLVVIGRQPGAISNLPAVAASGCKILIYLDVTYYNTFGPYHQLYYNAGTINGTLYPAIGSYAQGGTPQNGFPADFTTSLTTAKAKFKDVLRRIRADMPYVAGMFHDDQGPDWAGYNTLPWTQAWAPGASRVLNATEQGQAKAYQLTLAQGSREIADEFGWFTITNGEWRGDTHHGYPLTDTYGCSLYDGFCVEHHSYSGEGPFWTTVIAGQWGGRDINGQRPNIVIAASSGDVLDWRNKANVAWIAEQFSGQDPYSVPPSSGNIYSFTPHDLKMATGGSSPPTVTVTLSPSAPTVQTGTTQQFTATVSNAAPITAWKVNGTTGGDSTGGTITSGGLYTAPVSVPSGGVVTVTAQISTGESGAATVTVSGSVAPPPDATLPAAPAVPNKAFGNRFSGTIPNAMTPDYVRGVIVSTSEDGIIQALRVGVDGLGAASGSQVYTLRLYAVDAQGNPSSLIASTAEQTITAGTQPTWVRATFASPPSVTASTAYCLALHSGGTTAVGRFWRNDTAGVSRSLADTYSDGGVSSLAGGAVGSADISIYAEYTPVGVAASDLSGSSSGGSTTNGDITSPSVVPVPANEVAYFPETALVLRQIPQAYRVDAVGNQLYRVNWNPTSRQFEPAS